MIKRKNILELIGKNRGKYHSCILTCYSLDFSFFEERVLPTLRTANIKNVNLFVDGYYLENAQEITTGKEFKHNKTYNFQPVYENGVFHPKIMLLTGEKHGLLIMGSGNITSSGLSTNDEIWGAFHLENIENDNAPLFGAVWNYLQPYLDNSFGFVPQKIEWIRKYSPWLASLPTTNDWIKLKKIGLQLKFIANHNNNSTFSQLTSNIPKKNIAEILIISPYFDRKGQQLEQLKKHFSPKEMNCLVDPNSGLLPFELRPKVAEQINFYNWFDCKKDYDIEYNRLHAKMVHICNKNTEYLLIGSANVTKAGMGSMLGTAANAEAGILLRRELTSKSWIQELGIKIPKEKIDIKTAEQQGLGLGSVPRLNYKYKVLYSELRENEITIYLNRESTDKIEVDLINRFDIPIDNKIIQQADNKITIQVSDTVNAFKLAITNQNHERISNYSLIHRIEALLRCNPDPKQGKLDAMLAQEFHDGDGFTDLLQFVEFNWDDDNFDSETKASNYKSKENTDTHEPLQDYETLSADEFNKVSEESLLKQSGELSNSSVKIAEFLNLYSAGKFEKEDDFQESEEQKLLEDTEQKGEGNEIIISISNQTDGVKEKTALHKYFKKLNEFYDWHLDELLETSVLIEAPQTEITIRSLSNILIALHFLHIKYGKKFIVSKSDESGVTKKENYINVGRMDDSVISLKGFLVNVLGKFLLLCNAKTKNYEFQILSQRLMSNQRLLLLKSLFLIFNTPWISKESTDKEILILNCLYFSLKEKLLIKEEQNDLISKINEFNHSYLIPQFQQQLDEFIQNILHYYLNWLEMYSNQEMRMKTLLTPISDLKIRDIIFSSKIGFNLVMHITPTDDRFKLNLRRAGYDFNDGDFNLTDIQFGKKCIKY